MLRIFIGKHLSLEYIQTFICFGGEGIEEVYEENGYIYPCKFSNRSYYIVSY